jgi:hypothetical protein
VRSLAQTFYMDSEFGVDQELPRAGFTLENPFVYDAVAKDMKAMADQGLVEIVDERVSASRQEPLVERLRFRRLR